ncbi:uncharacterized protein LOC123686310 [Harmonia axyridis]|uniref:uncharacterized protein LOC123686310 n=1 Tax=Harmonia axyridis TaxID=115357 RepID=UPI001E27904E|nr:uncharacterized protein LOC123686310 [Harmonia axyridis]
MISSFLYFSLMVIIMLVLFDKTNMLMVLSIFSISLSLICAHISITREFAMKNLSDFVNYTQGGSQNINQTTLEIGHRQGRTYGHLVSFLLATFLTKAVAKYAASSLLPLAYRPLLTNKPVNYLSFNQIHQPSEAWKPSSPYLHGLTAFAAESYHNHYSPPDNFQPDEPHETGVVQIPPSSGGLQHGKYHEVVTTIESPDIADQSTSQSQYNYRRQLPPNRWNYYPRRGYPPQRRENENRLPIDHRYPYNRFRTTTPYYDYYDNYDDSPKRQTPYKTRRPIRRRPTTENYDYLYDSSEYGDSSFEDYIERTTRFYEKTTKSNKRQRKPNKKTKIKKRTDYSDEDLSSEESVENLESKEKETQSKREFKPQQRQATTTTTTQASTTTETTESTTTEESTTSMSTTSTTPSTTTARSNATQPTDYGQGGNYDHISFTYGPPVIHDVYSPPYNVHHPGYGYGPSNDEGISITQNPSRFPLFYHNFPYNNLFPQDLTKNAIVQKVHDIVGFEHDFIHRE